MSSFQNNKLEIRGIKKSFDETEVLRNISICLKKGEFISIVGQSGCGKTTLFNIIAGLIKPDAGNVYIDGEDLTGISGFVSYMQQKDLLLPWKSVIDNVSIPLTLKGMDKEEAKRKVMNYFELFGLSGFENVYPHKLSGGMRQRAALLRTYMLSKDIMLLDEPFGAIDAINREKLQSWLRDVLKNLGISLILITHEIDEAILISDRLYVMSQKPSSISAEFKCADYNQYELKTKVLEALEL